MGFGVQDNDDVRIKGDDGSADGVKITTTTDGSKKRLDVATQIVPSTSVISSLSKKYRVEDMNATTGGIARTTLVGATFTQVYSYTGSGVLLNFLVNIENKDKWFIRLQVDGEECFGSAGLFTGDLIADDAYDLDDGGSPLSSSEGRMGISMEEHDRFVWSAPANFPIRYESSVKVFIRRSDLVSKKFYAGFVMLTKET